MRQIAPNEVQELLTKGAVLLDIREVHETAKEYIEGAETWPLSQMPNQKPEINRKKKLIFFCRSGARTQMNAKKLDGAFANESFIMQNGLSGWRKAGYATIADKTSPQGNVGKIYLIVGAILLFTSYYLLK